MCIYNTSIQDINRVFSHPLNSSSNQQLVRDASMDTCSQDHTAGGSLLYWGHTWVTTWN